ncbi:MAG: hypothetical protein AUK47_26810 [Deltaproteobacteria bacterium CG2_30_63_29]|nr:MAG: hypothetical protein AUK47_26810 [Deltaproteobacteria bacterium CG2_30_63_29]
MSKDPQLQSGRTKAIDLSELEAQNKKKKAPGDEWTKESWDDPWADGPKERTWAEDERWAGDDAVKPSIGGSSKSDRTAALDLSDLNAPPPDDAEGWGQTAGRGWSAPKRDEMVASGDGWGGAGDWNDEGGGASTMAIGMDVLEEQQKDQGGRRKRQAAASYEKDDTSAYGDGKARRREIYQSKENLEFRDQGRMEYVDGQRQNYGGMVAETNEDWHSPSRRAFEEAAPPMAAQPQVLQPAERTVALDLGDVPDSFGMSSPGLPKTLAPQERTMALDAVDAVDAFRLSKNASPSSVGQLAGEEVLGSLVIFAQGSEPVVFGLNRGVSSIGRGLENNVVLSDPYSSRKHLLIVNRNDQFEVRDAGTDNGTSLNGHRISQALLRPGDHIEVGSTVLRFVAGLPGPQDMAFGPAPAIPPQHLAPPPDAGMMPPPHMAQMMAPQPVKKGKGLVLLLVFLVLILFAGGAAVAIYFFAFANKATTSTASDDKKEVDTKVSTGDMATGFEQTGSDGSDKRVVEAMKAHDDPDNAGIDEDDPYGVGGDVATVGEDPTGEGPPTADDKFNVPGEEPKDAPPIVAAVVDVDPILVNGLVGSFAMATGKPKPLPVTTAGEYISIKIESEPIDAEVYDSRGTLLGHTPYDSSRLKAQGLETWVVKKVGFDEVKVKVDLGAGAQESLNLGKPVKKKEPKPRKDKNKDKDKRPASTKIPTVD